MRRILIQTEQPWLHRGFMVVGGADGVTKLRYECGTIDDEKDAADRQDEIEVRDGGLHEIEISEVR